MDPTKRSLRECAELTECSYTSIQELSKRHNWFSRAEAYDKYHEVDALTPSHKSRLEAIKEYRETAVEISKELLRMGLQALQDLEKMGETPTHNTALKALELAFKLHAEGVQANAPTTDIETALATLHDAEILPGEIVDQIRALNEQSKVKIKGILSGRSDEKQTAFEVIE